MDVDDIIKDEDSEDKPTQSSSSDRLIIPLRRRKGRAFLQVSEVRKLFPDVSPDILCRLCEETFAAPSELLDLIPDITTEQIAEFYNIPIQRRRIADSAPDPVGPMLKRLKKIHDSRQVSVRHLFAFNVNILYFGETKSSALIPNPCYMKILTCAPLRIGHAIFSCRNLRVSRL